jgi:hypothetical protein
VNECKPLATGTGTGGRRHLLHRTIGFTMGKAGCGKELTVRVEHENDGRHLTGICFPIMT